MNAVLLNFLLIKESYKKIVFFSHKKIISASVFNTDNNKKSA